MMRYTIMKRVTQMLASILFIITVLTVYLAFDFAINTAVSHKYSTDKHSHREHIHDDITFRKTSTHVLLSKVKTTNQTLKSNINNEHNPVLNQERRTRGVKQRVKPAQFHKSKTGIRINQLRRIGKEQRKRLSTTKIIQHKIAKAHA